MFRRWWRALVTLQFGTGAGLVDDHARTAPGRNQAPPGKARRDFRAVSLVAQAHGCREVLARRGQRYLLGEEPRLPLPECSTPAQCRCRYQSHADRRQGERRSPWVVWPRLRILGIDRRGRAGGRRQTDRAPD